MNLIQFQQTVAAADKPLVLDFWAEWCVPCRVTKPILEKLAGEFADKVDFLAVNADDSREVLRHLQVIGIPTVLAIRKGQVLGRVTGAQTEAGYRTLFTTLMERQAVKIPVTLFDRLLRLGTGSLFGVIGISTGSWLMMGIGGMIAFLGIYDRCPVWQACTGMLRNR